MVATSRAPHHTSTLELLHCERKAVTAASIKMALSGREVSTGKRVPGISVFTAGAEGWDVFRNSAPASTNLFTRIAGE